MVIGWVYDGAHDGQGWARRARRALGKAMSHEGPIISMMLSHAQELGLTPEQEKQLRICGPSSPRSRFGARGDPVAEIELDALLAEEA